MEAGGIHLFLNGTRGLAVAARLCAEGLAPARVYVTPNRATDPSMVGFLATLGLAPVPVADCHAPDFLERLAAARPEILVVAGFSTIFRGPILSIPALGVINLHGGLLPAYRGGSPLNWQIIHGSTTAGLSVILMDEGIDTGPVLAAGEVPIGPDDTIADAQARADGLFPELTVAAIIRLRSGDRGAPQPETGGAYWHQRNDADGAVDWARMTAVEVHDLVRAITRPYPGAFSLWDGRKVRLWRTQRPAGVPIRGVPGRVLHLQGAGPWVACRDRAIRLLEYSVEAADAIRLPHGAHLG